MRTLMAGNRSYSEHLITSIAYAPSGDRMAVGSGCIGETWAGKGSRGRVKILDPIAGDDVATLFDRKNFVRSVVYSPDGSLLAAGAGDRTVRLWEVRTLREVAIFRGHTRVVASLAFSPDGATLASAAADNFGKFGGGEFRVWDLQAGAPIVHQEQGAGAWSVAFSPDGRTLAVGSDKIRFWDSLEGTLRSEIALKARAKAVRYLHGGDVIASASGRELAFWDVPSGKPLARCKGHGQPIHAMDLSPDGLTLATASADETVRFWDTQSFRERACFRWEIGAVRSVAFSPDGTVIAAGGSGASILIVWDLDS